MFYFTIRAEGILTEIISDGFVSKSWYFSSGEVLPPKIPVKILWDTSCSKSCISNRIVEQLKLVPQGLVLVNDSRGEIERQKFYISIYFPGSNYALHGIEATDFDAPDDFDMLIGMEIITKGDFAISSENGNTVVSFAVPSQGPIDFEEVGFLCRF